MASYELYFSFLVLMTSLSLVLPISSSHALSGTHIDASLPPAKSEKVKLSLYYESGCPYCANFITNNLVQIFKTDLYTIVDLRLVPWGNARFVEPNNTIECQHGSDECYFNTIEACAIKAWPEVVLPDFSSSNKHFRFIHCVEYEISRSKYKDREAMWKFCSEYWQLSSNPIADCYNSGDGRKLIMQNAAETGRLNPPHTYVPWLLVNNQPLYADYENYVAHICKIYKGKNPAEACKTISPKFNSNYDEKPNSVRTVCYVDETRNSTLFVRPKKVVRSAEVAMGMEPSP